MTPPLTRDPDCAAIARVRRPAPDEIPPEPPAAWQADPAPPQPELCHLSGWHFPRPGLLPPCHPLDKLISFGGGANQPSQQTNHRDGWFAPPPNDMSLSSG